MAMATPPCPLSSSPAAAPRTTATTSACTTETSRGTHVFRVYQYSHLKGLAPGVAVTSATFKVGGFAWAVRLYPSGVAAAGNNNEDRMPVYVVTRKPFDGEVKIAFQLSLVNQITGRSSPLGGGTTAVTACVAVGAFLRKSVLEAPASPYLRNDHLDIRCVVTVIAPPRVSKTLPLPQIAPPPPGGLSSDLAALLQEKHGADVDVTFHVRGESFAAHRAVLAARSPVFMAELLSGPTMERETGHVTIEDVQPAVFGAFLHFVYTDALPAMVDDLDGDVRTDMLRHLLVAADRYAVGRLKQLCESLLCGNLDVGAARTTLDLAEQHHCDLLREACQQFLEANSH